MHHTDEKREWAYDRTSHIGKLDKGLDEAKARGYRRRYEERVEGNLSDRDEVIVVSFDSPLEKASVKNNQRLVIPQQEMVIADSSARRKGHE